MGLFKKLLAWKKRREDSAYDIEDWNEVVYDRDDLQINNKEQRQEYIKGCMEQIAEASRELDNLQFEYNMVTSYLKDMEEIEALPEEEMEVLRDCARKIDVLEVRQSDFLNRERRMTDAKFREIERMEAEVQDGYDKLMEAEEYQDLVKRDLRRLDGEKHAYIYRRNELKRTIEDTRSMAIVCTTAICICIVLLMVLQFGFHMNAKVGYLAVAALGATAITVIFLKNINSASELERVEGGITRLINLQNTVKIRYVNNTHLLDYLYLKYNVSSAGELGKSWQLYQEEKEERRKYQQAERELDERQKELLHTLRRYQVKDPIIWLHQTAALLDKKEMVEIRHKLIIRRQSLRRRMDYNKEVIAGKAQDEIKDLVEKYPKYAMEILKMVDEYEKMFS